jgi:hypothetical protein
MDICHAPWGCYDDGWGMHVYTYMCIWIYIDRYIFMYMCIYVYIYMYMCILVYM